MIDFLHVLTTVLVLIVTIGLVFIAIIFQLIILLFVYAPGDMNRDGELNITDLSILSAQINAQHE